MKKLLILLGLIIAVALSYFLFGLGKKIPLESQEALLEGLRNTSAIIFGVLGAWLALIYPETMQVLMKKHTAINSAREIRIKRLFAAVAYSAIILCLIMIMATIKPIVLSYGLSPEEKSVYSGISFSITVLLTLLQIWCLLVSVLPIEWAQQETDEIHERKDSDQRRKKLIPKVDE